MEPVLAPVLAAVSVAYFDWVNVVAGIVDVVVGIFVLLELRRLRLRPSVLGAALVGFFVLEGAATLNFPDPLLGYDPVLQAALDLLTLMVLAVLLVNARRIARSTLSRLDAARVQAQEYERARRDYASLVRHRVFNPLTAARGAAETLAARDDLDVETRRRLAETIVAASRRIEALTLEPERVGAEERELDATPRVET